MQLLPGDDSISDCPVGSYKEGWNLNPCTSVSGWTLLTQQLFKLGIVCVTTAALAGDAVVYCACISPTIGLLDADDH
jgi:hypothetical protein